MTDTLIIICSSIACIFSILNIAIIVKLNTYSGHVVILLSMAISQLIYDAFMYPTTVGEGKESTDTFILICVAMQAIGGAAVAIYSNIMSTCVLYVIMYRKSFRFLDNVILFHFAVGSVILLLIVLFSLSYLSVDMLGAMRTLYASLRFLSILYNFGACGLAYYYVQEIMGLVSEDTNRASFSKAMAQDSAICILAKRMMYYPVVQIVCRSGCVWYEWQYGWDFDPHTVTKLQFAAQVTVAVITPAAGVGYCVIYVLMQPLARRLVRGWYRQTMNAAGTFLGLEGMDAQEEEVGEFGTDTAAIRRHCGVPNESERQIDLSTDSSGGDSANTGGGTLGTLHSFMRWGSVETPEGYRRLSNVSDSGLMTLLDEYESPADTASAHIALLG